MADKTLTCRDCGNTFTFTEGEQDFYAQKGYSDAELPTAATISTKLNALGYYPQTVAKSRPQKKSPKPMRSSPR